MNLEQMTQFNPAIDDPRTLPNCKGIYFITAKNVECLPDEMKGLTYTYYEGRPIIYVGISKRGIKFRDYRNHFRGTARNSTLRKSIGVLMRFKRVYEIKDPDRYKFELSDERNLTQWMNAHLCLHYKKHDNPDLIEKHWINRYSTPLNIKENHSEINEAFRQQLRDIRNTRND